jgi:sterol desaturase/sphingolipid hydroxylase (fatty acid hydroxylase superfamily)
VNLIFSFTVSACVLLGAAGLMVWHLRGWRGVQSLVLETDELRFRRRRFYRHMQTTALMGLAGAALPFALPVTRALPKAGVIYVGGVLLILVWVALLAVVDIWTTRFHYGRLRDRNQLEQTRLKAELRLAERGQANDSARLPKSNGAKLPGSEPEAGS